MARAPYAPKSSATAQINAGLAEIGVDAEDAVNVLGFYGEKGVTFFPNPAGLGEDGATLGFMLVGRDIAPKHYNMSDGAARSLAELILNTLDTQIGVEDMEVTTTVSRYVLS